VNQKIIEHEVSLIMSKIDPGRIKTAKKLKIDRNFTPCPIQDDDELY